MAHIKVSKIFYENYDTHRIGVDQHINGVEVKGEGDLSILQLLKPVLEQYAPEILVEGARVGEEGC